MRIEEIPEYEAGDALPDKLPDDDVDPNSTDTIPDVSITEGAGSDEGVGAADLEHAARLGSAATEVHIGDVEEVAITAPDEDDEEVSSPVRETPDVAAPPAPRDQRPAADVPQPAAETHEAEEQEPTSSRVRVDAILRPGQQGDGQQSNRVDTGDVVDATLNGETMEIVVTRDAQSGEVKFEATPSLLPQGATTSEIPPDQVGADGEKAPSRFKFWARFRREKHPPSDNGEAPARGQSQAEPEPGVRIEDLLAAHNGPVKIVIRGEGISGQEHTELMSRVGDMLHDAEGTKGFERAARILTGIQDTLHAAEDVGLVNNSVLVGAEDEASLRRAATQMVRSVLPTDGQTWSVETERGRVRVYPDEEAARAAGENDLNAYMTAEEFGDLIRYPDREVRGFSLRDRHNFAVNREVPAGKRVIGVGTIEDNDGNEAGDFPVPVEDLLRHTLVVGATGSAKTYQLRELAAKAARDSLDQQIEAFESQTGIRLSTLPRETADAALKAWQEQADDRPLKIVVIDQRKSGNYSEPLVNQMAGMGLPPEMATARVIRPGEEGLRPTLDLFNPKDSSPVKQMEIAVNALTLGITSDPEAQRMLKRYISDGVRTAYEKLGWNMETDQSRFPEGTPAHPTMPFVVRCIREALSNGDYEQKVKGNLSEFAAGQVQSTLDGISGRFFQGGHPIEFDKVMEDRGVTVFELDNMTDANARNVATAGIFRELIKAVDAENPDGGEQTRPRLLVIMDEAGKTFNNSDAGGENADLLTYIRTKGIEVAIGAQIIDDMNLAAIGNIRNIWAMRVELQKDRALLAEKMGATPVEQLDYLVSDELTPGKALAFGEGMSRPIKTTTTHPRDIPKGVGRVEDARTLVGLGAYREHYGGEVLVKARDYLRNDKTGNLIRAWAEMNASLVPLGRLPAPLADPKYNDRNELIGGRLKLALQGMTGADALKRDSAVVMAAAAAVDSRPEIMNVATREELTNYLVDNMLGQIRGEDHRDEDPRIDLALNIGHYSAVKDALHATGVLTAPRLEDSESYEKLLGKVGGATAQEQLENLSKIEKAVKTKFVSALEELADGDPTGTGGIRMAAELVKLVAGSANPPAATRQLLEEAKATLAKKNIDLDPAVHVNGAIDPENSNGFSYQKEGPGGIPAMRAALEKAKTDAENAPAIDMGRWKRVYNEEFEGATAKEQLDNVLKAEAALIASSGYEVTESDMLFAPDLLDEGLTMDNVGAALIRADEPKGHLVEKQRRAQNDGKKEDLSLVALAERDDPTLSQSQRWANAVGTNVLYNKSFAMPGSANRYLIQQINGYVKLLRTNAKLARERKARNSGPK